MKKVIQKIIQRIRKSSTLQLSLIIVLILTVMVFRMSQIFSFFQRIEVDNANVLANTILTQTESSLSSYYESLEGTAESFGYSSEVSRFFKDTPLERVKNIDDLKTVFSNTILLEDHIRAIKLYDDDMNLIASFGQNYQLTKGEKRLRNVVEFNMDDYQGKNEDKAYAFYLPEYNVKSGRYRELVGMCVFFLDKKALDDTILNSLSALSSAVEVDDQNGNLIAFQQTDELNQKSIDKFLKNGQYNYTSGYFRKNGWKIITAVSVEANAGKEQTYSNLIILTLVIMAAAFAILIVFSYLRLALPIHNLQSFIEKATGNQSLRIRSKRIDEIGMVSNSLDNLLDENKKAIHEIRESKILLYEVELSRQKMKILAYRNQINPHFLYNTFSCISGMALMHDEEEIADITMALSDIFRYAVKGDNIVTVSDEIENLKKYRKIIEARFMEDIETHKSKIHILMQVDPDAEGLPIPKLLFQPLVENSVFHGLEQKMGEGVVTVRIYYYDGRIRILVSDNGVGMPRERLLEIRKSYEKLNYTSQENEDTEQVPEFMRPVDEVEGSGTDIKNVVKTNKKGSRNAIGLGNIIQRLRLFYGASYTFMIDSTEESGTTVKISISDHISRKVMDTID